MFKFLYGLILFFVLLVLLAGALGIGFLRSIFGIGKQQSSRRSDDTTHTPSNPDKDKIFGDHEGEYVDFEEIDTPESPEGNLKESEKEE